MENEKLNKSIKIRLNVCFTILTTLKEILDS